MNPATRKALIAQKNWDVAQLHELEKRARERSRIAALCHRDEAVDGSEPGVQVEYRPKDKRRRVQRERFYTEKAGNHWVSMHKRMAGEDE